MTVWMDNTKYFIVLNEFLNDRAKNLFKLVYGLLEWMKFCGRQNV